VTLFDPEPAPPAAPVVGSGRVRIGTSGYSFSDWVGAFYPPGMKSSEFLPYYARHFDTLEVNTTYYGIPRPQVLDAMAKKTPSGFEFVVKLNRAMTHEHSTDPAVYRQFLDATAPLAAHGKHAGLLGQFPWKFQRTPENEAHLVAVRELLPDPPLHVEFRHESWLSPELGPWLAEHRLGYCVPDEPRLKGLVPPTLLVTSGDAYVRLHGRNAKAWWTGDRSTRYDYNYSEDELKEWVRRLQDLAQQARRTYLFFNNCHAGQAARNAKLMQELLRSQGSF